MLAPRGLAARLSLSSIPLLDGFAEVTRQGIRASLHDANRAACGPSVFEHPQLEAMPEFDALFDPQTSGGLLLAAAPGAAAELAARISDATGCAAVIGEVTFGPPGQIELRESWCRT
jgi:selenide,water dikinase